LSSCPAFLGTPSGDACPPRRSPRHP